MIQIHIYKLILLVIFMHRYTFSFCFWFWEMLNSHSLRGSKLHKQKLHLVLWILAETAVELLIQFPHPWSRMEVTVGSCYEGFVFKSYDVNCRRGEKKSSSESRWLFNGKAMRQIWWVTFRKQTFHYICEIVLEAFLHLILNRARWPKLLCETKGMKVLLTSTKTLQKTVGFFWMRVIKEIKHYMNK